MPNQTRRDLRGYWLAKIPRREELTDELRAGYEPWLQEAWRARGPCLLPVICNECGGGKAAELGGVWWTDVGRVLGVELVNPPRAPRRGKRPLTADDLGWTRRGQPDASYWLFWADDAAWRDEDFVGNIYCQHHGWRITTFGEVRAAVARKAKLLAL